MFLILCQRVSFKLWLAPCKKSLGNPKEKGSLWGLCLAGIDIAGEQQQGEPERNFHILRRPIWVSNVWYKMPRRSKTQALQVTGSPVFNINLGLKLGGKVIPFNNFYLRKTSFEKTKNAPTMWVLAQYLNPAWLENEKPRLEVSCCSGPALRSYSAVRQGLSFPHTLRKHHSNDSIRGEGVLNPGGCELVKEP